MIWNITTIKISWSRCCRTFFGKAWQEQWTAVRDRWRNLRFLTVLYFNDSKKNWLLQASLKTSAKESTGIMQFNCLFLKICLIMELPSMDLRSNSLYVSTVSIQFNQLASWLWSTEWLNYWTQHYHCSVIMLSPSTFHGDNIKCLSNYLKIFVKQ